MKAFLLFVSIAIAALAAGATVVYGGFYDISATDPHLAPTYALLDTAMRRSVKRRAAGVAVPPLDDAQLVSTGLAHFRQHCVQCHGAPGIAPEPFALGLTPAPANLAHTAKVWRPAELFWVIKYGIKMTGMPAWQFRMSDDDMWAIVAFLRELPKLSPQQYKSLQAPTPVHSTNLPAREADPERGKTAILQYACVTCHRVPGVAGANAPVGPPLDRIGTRAVLAGVLPNTPENMVRWLREPQKVNPRSAMPDLGLTERDARDIAAYLSTLK